MIRVLLLPSVARKEAGNHPAYTEFLSLAACVAKNNPGEGFFYCVVPSWSRDSLVVVPGVHYEYVDATRNQGFTRMVGLPPFELAQRFARRGGRFVVDVVLTDEIYFAPYLQRVLSDPVAEHKVLFFLRDYEFVHLSSESIVDKASLAVGFASGSLLSRSEQQGNEMLGFSSQNANPAISRLVANRSAVWPVGYDFSKLEPKKNKDFTLILATDFSDVSYCARVLRLYRTVSAAAQKKIKVVVASQENQKRAEKCLPDGDASFVSSFRCGLTTEELMGEFASADAFFVPDRVSTDQNYETEILGLACGCVGVLPNREQYASRIGSVEVYPYYYEPAMEKDQAAEFLLWGIDNRDGFSSVMAESNVSGMLRELHDKNRTSRLIWDTIKKRVAAAYTTHDLMGKAGKKTSLVKSVHEVAKKLGDRFDLVSFVDVLEEQVSWMKPWGKKGAIHEVGQSTTLPTLYQLREILDNLGWVDVGGSPGVTVQRKKQGVKL